MRSIRLSLLLYFLALLGLALSTVFTLVYQTTAQTLRDKQASTANLVWTQYNDHIREARAALDQRIFRQAMLLVSKSRTKPASYEFNSFVLAMGHSATSASSTVPLYQPGHVPGTVINRFRFVGRQDVFIRDAEDYLPPPGENQPQEYFQTFGYTFTAGRWSMITYQRSASLGEHFLELPRDIRKVTEADREHFDDVQLGDKSLRRVTLKAYLVGRNPFFWMPGFGKRGGVRRSEEFFYIQYASDTARLEARVAGFQQQRDEQLAALEGDTAAALAHLRGRLGWIALVTFAGIVTGGFVLVRLGLAPLSRLSDAVSQVTEKDFRLKIDSSRLPNELRPIAGRLAETLEQLRDAFAREKQAAADISHELRTPLAALTTTVEVALRKARSTDEYREILEECQVSARHMGHLVEQLLALARLDAGAVRLQVEPVDISDLAREAADMVRPLAKENGLTLTLDAGEALSAEPLLAEADPNKLREIILNLLHNAVEYNRPDGRIDMTVKRRKEGVELKVSDTGIGIAPEARPHIFERFYRADPSRHADSPHCGLGLAIVKSYVDLMGGTIGVESDGGGTTFRVWLPLPELQLDQPAPEGAIRASA
jgi:heavy metal sensor kinase